VIISASRRTDIPAFYAEWFLRRVRAGACVVANPLNPRAASRVSLKPEDVDAIVFWTRNPRPLLSHLAELDERGFRYYFLFTVLDYPRTLDPSVPPARAAVAAFRQLARRLGPERVVWRYDPIVFSNVTGAAFHRRAFEDLAAALQGCTTRCVISFLTIYRKMAARLQALAGQGLRLETPAPAEIEALVRALATTAAQRGMELTACAEERDLAALGVRRGKCVDDELIRRQFGIRVASRKDPSQRERCRCVVSRDIGAYDTCVYGCRYCYATNSFERARENHARHDPAAESL